MVIVNAKEFLLKPKVSAAACRTLVEFALNR